MKIGHNVKTISRVWCLVLTAVLLAGAAAWAPQAAADDGKAPVAAAPAAARDGGKATPAEIEMGKQAAAQIEKEYKVLDHAAALETIKKIVARLAPHTERPAIDYQAKILAEGGINAFSLPGGYIYVTKGLLDAVESEDELAAVIAHEMGHICLGHGMDLARREARMNNKMALAVLAAVVSGQKVDPGNMIVLGSLLKTGLLSGYSQEAELQADAHGVIYLQRAGYHSVAMLTVIQGLAHMELTRPYVEMGIFRTHPYPEQRARAVSRELVGMGIDDNPRSVLSTLKTKAEAVEESGHTIGRVSLDEFVIFEPAVPADGVSPQERAERIAADLRRLILDNLMMYELQVVNGSGEATVMARGERLVTVLPGDAEFHKTTVEELATKAATNIKLALWQETVRRAY